MVHVFPRQTHVLVILSKLSELFRNNYCYSLSISSRICRIFAANGITSTSWCAFQKCYRSFASHRHAFHLASTANKLHASGIAGKSFQTTSSSSVPSCQPFVSVCYCCMVCLKPCLSLRGSSAPLMTKIRSRSPQNQAVLSTDEVHNYWTKLVKYVAVYLCF